MNQHTSGTLPLGNQVLDGTSGLPAISQTADHPRRAALWYASLGYGVFPCKPRLKVPATMHGFKDGTTDPTRIRERFKSDHNLGLLAPAGVLVIDFDVSKDARMLHSQRRADTKQRLSMLEATFSEVEEAPLHATPSGGYHVFLRLPEGAPRLITGAWPRGSDVTHGELRGLGRAYVVAPPSVTADGAYRVLRPLVTIHELSVASPQLLEYLHPPQKPRRRRQPSGHAAGAAPTDQFATQVAAVRSAPEGNRNNTLNRSAFIVGLLVAAGELDEATAEDALLAAAQDAGLPHREALATLNSGLTAGMREGGNDAAK